MAARTITFGSPNARHGLTAAFVFLASLSRPVLLLMVFTGVVFTLWSFYPVMRVQYREERAYAQLKAEYDSIEARNARLRTQVAHLQTAEGVMDEAREDGLVLQGEHPIVVTDASQPATQALAQKAFKVEPEHTAEAPHGPWTPVLDLLFGVRK